MAIFPKRLGIFQPNFTRLGLLNVHMYARMQIFIQLSPTVTKCDHPACVSVDGGHFEHIMVHGSASYGITSSKLQAIE